MPDDDPDRPRLDDEDRAAEQLPDEQAPTQTSQAEAYVAFSGLSLSDFAELQRSGSGRRLRSPDHLLQALPYERAMETATEASERINDIRSRMYPAINYLRRRFTDAGIEPHHVRRIQPIYSSQSDELRLNVIHRIVRNEVTLTTVAITGDECREHNLHDINSVVRAYPYEENYQPTYVSGDQLGADYEVRREDLEVSPTGRRRRRRISEPRPPIPPDHERHEIAGGGHIDVRTQIENREIEARLAHDHMRRMEVDPIVVSDDAVTGELRIRIQRIVLNPVSVGPAWIMRSVEITVDNATMNLTRDTNNFGVEVFGRLTDKWARLYGEEPLLAFNEVGVDLAIKFAEMWGHITNPALIRGSVTISWPPQTEARRRARQNIQQATMDIRRRNHEANTNRNLPLPDDRAKDAEGNYIRAKAGRDPWANDHEVIDLDTGLVVQYVVEVDCVAGWCDTVDPDGRIHIRIFGRYEISPKAPDVPGEIEEIEDNGNNDIPS